MWYAYLNESEERKQVVVVVVVDHQSHPSLKNHEDFMPVQQDMLRPLLDK